MSKKTKSLRKNVRTLALAMPDYTGRALGYTAGILFAAYLALVIYTVVLATVQTSLAAEVRDLEGSISSLESTYYDSIAAANASSPAEIGLVKPAEIEYATEKPAQTLTFARN